MRIYDAQGKPKTGVEARYANIYVADGATPQASISTTPAKVTGFAANGPANDATPDHTNDQITIGTAGIYAVNFNISFSGTVSTVFTFKLRNNAVEQAFGCTRTLGTGGDTGSAGFNAIISLSASDVLTIYVEADGASKSITPVDMSLSVREISAINTSGPTSYTETNNLESAMTDVAADEIVYGASANTGAYGKISTITEEASPASGDWLLGETAEGNLRRYDVGNMPAGSETNDLESSMTGVAADEIVYGASANTGAYAKISAITEEASPASGDWLLGETAEGNLRRYDVGNMPAGSETNNLETACADILENEVPVGAAGGDAVVYTATEGTGSVVRATSPTLTTPNIGTPSAGDLSNCSNYPETSHADVVVDGDFSSAGYCKTDGAGAYSVQATPIPTSDTAAKCTDALADQTSANETSHADVVQDGDFASDGYLQRSGGAGSYAVQATPIPTSDTAAKCTDATADNTASNETSHADVVQDGDFGSDGYLKRSGGAGSYAVQTTPIPTADTEAKCTDATADNTAANETYGSGSEIKTAYEGENFAANTLLGNATGGAAGPTELAIGSVTEEGSPAATDMLLGWEAGGALRKFDIGNLPAGSEVNDLSASVTWANHAHTGSSDGGKIDHDTALTNNGTTSHADIDTHVGAANPHSGSAASGANSDITSLSGLTTPLSEAQGGTDQSTYAQGDILYASAANTLAKLAVGGANTVLHGGATVPSYSAVDLANDVTGTTGETNGGTGQSTYTAGDVLYSDGSNSLGKLGIGTAYQYLRTNSGATAPEWYTLEHSKSITIEDPAENDLFAMWITNKAITVTEIQAICEGGTSVVCNIENAATVTAAGTLIDQITPTTAITSETTITSANVAADQVISINLGTVTGSVNSVTVTVNYRENA